MAPLAPLVVLRRKNCYKLSLWLLPFLTFFTAYLGCFFIIQKAPKLVRHAARASASACRTSTGCKRHIMATFCPRPCSCALQSGKVSNTKNAWISAIVGKARMFVLVTIRANGF